MRKDSIKQNIDTAELASLVSEIRAANDTIRNEFDRDYMSKLFEILNTSWTSYNRETARNRLENLLSENLLNRFNELNDYIVFNECLINGWEVTEELNKRISEMHRIVQM